MKRKIAIIIVLTLVITAFATMSSTVARNNGKKPDWQSGNACFECEQAGGCGEFSWKIEGYENGVYDTNSNQFGNDPVSPPNNAIITISDSDGITFDWTSDQPVCAVIVKGGPSAKLYKYPDGAYEGTDLTAPVNPNNPHGKHYEISHIAFCWNKEEIIIFPPDGGNAYIGYEDRTGGDFDYNDFGMNMHVKETYINDCLSEIELSFTSLVKKAGDVHDIHLKRTFSDNTDYEYTITRSATAQGTEKAAGDYTGSGDLDIILFDSSKGVKKTVDIILTVTSCDDYYNEDPDAPRWDVNTFFENYDPWMYDKSYGPNSWHITDMQPANSKLPTQGYNVPYILVVPYTDWPAPDEAQTITDLYHDFDDYYRTQSPLYENWYQP